MLYLLQTMLENRNNRSKQIVSKERVIKKSRKVRVAMEWLVCKIENTLPEVPPLQITVIPHSELLPGLRLKAHLSTLTP